MERKDSASADVRLASAVTSYLEDGEEGVARRIRQHDHNHMLALCKVAWRCCSDRPARDAMRALAHSKPLDGRCLAITAAFLGAGPVASKFSERPFWSLPVPDLD
jgi:hypothetical protein